MQPRRRVRGPGEQIVDAVNYLEFSDNLDNFVKGVQTILTREEASSGGYVAKHKSCV